MTQGFFASQGSEQIMHSAHRLHVTTPFLVIVSLQLLQYIVKMYHHSRRRHTMTAEDDGSRQQKMLNIWHFTPSTVTLCGA